MPDGSFAAKTLPHLHQAKAESLSLMQMRVGSRRNIEFDAKKNLATTWKANERDSMP